MFGLHSGCTLRTTCTHRQPILFLFFLMTRQKAIWGKPSWMTTAESKKARRFVGWSCVWSFSIVVHQVVGFFAPKHNWTFTFFSCKPFASCLRTEESSWVRSKKRFQGNKKNPRNFQNLPLWERKAFLGTRGLSLRVLEETCRSYPSKPSLGSLLVWAGGTSKPCPPPPKTSSS